MFVFNIKCNIWYIFVLFVGAHFILNENKNKVNKTLTVNAVDFWLILNTNWDSIIKRMKKIFVSCRLSQR